MKLKLFNLRCLKRISDLNIIKILRKRPRLLIIKWINFEKIWYEEPYKTDFGWYTGDENGPYIVPKRVCTVRVFPTGSGSGVGEPG